MNIRHFKHKNYKKKETYKTCRMIRKTTSFIGYEFKLMNS